MGSDAKKLLEEALKLPPEARAVLAGSLLESLDLERIDEDAEARWEAEIARRSEALASGQARPVPWPEARRIILGGRRGPGQG